ncbi:hypothetical protein Tco_0290833 [Tanacetum coccineum]
MTDEVKLCADRLSPYVCRVKIALNMKGIKYENIEEDIWNKSSDLLNYNPVHKKVPVLVHNGNPICESLAITEYIDNVWKGVPILPKDPYEKSVAQFLAKFMDDKPLIVLVDCTCHHPDVVWVKYAKGISRYYTLDENSYPMFWNGDEEMDLFAFIRHSDPTKVVIGERNVGDGEVKLLTSTEGHTVPLVPPASTASGEAIAQEVSEVAVEKNKKVKRKRKVIGDASGSNHPTKKLRDDYHATTPNVAGKSLAAIRGLMPEGSNILGGVTKPLVAASVTPTPDGGYDGPTNFVSEHNLRNRHPRVRSSIADDPIMTIAVTTTVATNAYAVPPLKVTVKSTNFEIFGDSAFVSEANADVVDLDSETLNNIYVPKWKVKNDFVFDDPHVCRDLTDCLALPSLFSQLHSMDYDQLYTEFNVGVTRHMCLGVEVRIRAEHTLELKDRLEDKCASQSAILSERDAEIAHLRSLLSLNKDEATEALRLRGQLSVVDVADAAKGNELRELKERNFVLEGEKDVLSKKVTTLESVTAAKEAELASLSSQVVKLTSDLSGFQLSRDELNSKVASLESKRDNLVNQAMALGNRVAELDAQLLEMAAHLEEEFYPRFLTAISGRRWILTHGLKLVLFKCLQSTEYLLLLGEAIGCAVNKGMHDGLAAGIDHGKAGRDFSVIEAYDPSAEAKYVDAVNALRTVDFSLLSELRFKKDASMDSLYLEGPFAEIPRAEDLQPSLEQLMFLIYRTEDYVPLPSKSLIGEASTSTAPTAAGPITTLSMTFASSGVVPPLSISDYYVLDMEPHDEDPSVVTFEKEELDTSLE